LTLSFPSIPTYHISMKPQHFPPPLNPSTLRSMVDTILSKANLLLSSRQYLAAITEYTSLLPHLTTPTQLSIAYNNRGQCHYQLVNFPEAIADYTTSLTYNPLNHTTLYNRAQVLYRLSEFSKARCDIVKCLEVNPGFTEGKECLEAINDATNN